MSINKENFSQIDKPEFLIIETIDNNIKHLQDEIKRLEELKEEIRYELKYGEGWSPELYRILRQG